MRTKSQSIRYILAATVALSWFTMVKAEEPHCQDSVETIIVQPEVTSYRINPGEYEWVEGEIKGASLEYRVEPATFETITEISTDIRQIPPKKLDRIVLKTEAFPVERFKPNQIKDGRTRIQIKRPTYEAITLPAQTKTYSRAAQCNVVSATVAGE